MNETLYLAVGTQRIVASGNFLMLITETQLIILINKENMKDLSGCVGKMKNF